MNEPSAALVPVVNAAAIATVAAAAAVPRLRGASCTAASGRTARSSTRRSTSQYGDAIVHHGLVPYRDFAVEYPPGALPVFVAPIARAATTRRAFAWLMAACGVALRRRRRALAAGEAAFFVALSPLLVGSLILSRFDLWPALLATAALAALLRDRHRLGWALLGAAVAAKLWPLVLVPLALVWSLRARPRPCAPLVGACASLAVAFVPFASSRRTGSGQPQRPGLAAAADREPRRVAPHDVRPPAGSSRRTARRTSRPRRARRRVRAPAARGARSRSGSPSRAARRRASGSCATPPPASARSSPSARCSRRSS